MDKAFIQRIYKSHIETKRLPSPDTICRLTSGILEMLFPVLSDKRYTTEGDFMDHFMSLRFEMQQSLRLMQPDLNDKADKIAFDFFDALPELYDTLQLDAESILNGDPAAVDIDEVIRTYPGFYAIAMYRLAHYLDELGVPFIPRVIAEYAHRYTGIEIHPQAKIGKRFFIDHGTGIVIGGTVIIGENVKLYQGVTLGALSVSKQLAETKRHPTIGDNVIIYAGATILGGETFVGSNSVIGGNVWLTKSVPDNSRIYHQAQVKVKNAE